jgi:septal ring factor EnvC (AmiA/AmiB activator)
MRAALVFGGAALSSASYLRLQVNPVSRVAELLENLAKKLEADGKEEKKLYAKYQCWCTTVQKDKAASIESANERITELGNYIAEIESGRLEMTDERSSLDGEIAQLKADLLDLHKTHVKDEETKQKEEDVLGQAKDALTDAIASLDKAISGHEDGVFFALSKGMVHMIRKSQDRLNEQDARFLDEVLTEADPNAQGSNWDQKKLNRKATFSMGYKARSQKIRQILADMKTDVEKQRHDLEEEYDKKYHSYSDLKETREDELKAAVATKNQAAEETAARNKAKQEAQDEKSDLESAVADDEEFVSVTKSSCAAKATEFDARVVARKEEIAAVHEAVSILRSDDARDSFKKSFDSQSFVQQSSFTVSPRQLALAVQTLRSVHTRSLALSALAASLTTSKAHGFSGVIGSIDKMIKNLEDEQNSDLEKKQDCDETRKTKTTDAKDDSQLIDRKNARIEEVEADTASLNKKIADAEAEIVEAQKAKADADSQREQEAAEFAASKADDEMAKTLVKQAHSVLETRMQALAASAALIQSHNHQTPGGQAPPPPPETFEGSYGGAQGEANGILAILKTIEEDIEHDMAKAEKEETDAIAAHTALVSDLEAGISAKESFIAELEGEIADNDEDISDYKTEVTGLEGSLQGTLDLLKQITPGCDFIAANYDIRTENRNMEIDGLNKAKAVLQGASPA